MPTHQWPGEIIRPSARRMNADSQRLANTVPLGSQTSGPARNGLSFVWNRSEEIVPAGGILGIDRTRSLVEYTLGDPDDEWRNWPGVVGVTPTYDLADGHAHLVDWCYVVEELQPLEIGRCVLSGLAWAYVEITHASHQHVRPVAGNVERLVSAPTGMARIINKQPPSAGSTRLCLVDLSPGGLCVFDGLCSTAIPAAGLSGNTLTRSTTGRVTLRELRDDDGDDVWHDAGIVLPITHLSTSLTVDVGTYCEVRRHGNEWRAYPDCSGTSISLSTTIQIG